MEGYVEVVVTKKMTFDVQVKRFFATVLPLMLAIFLILQNTDPIMKIVVFLAVVGLVYLAYRMFMNFYIEWEYTFITNEVSFAKIMNKSKRKDLLTCQVKDTVFMAKNTDKQHLGNIPADAKKYNFLSGTGAEYYIWLVKTKNNKMVCIYFEPDTKMLECIKKLARDRVYI